MSVIQQAIDRRRAGGNAPQLEQQTGAAAAPGAGPAPAEGGPDTQALLAQRAGAEAPPTEGAAAAPETTPEDAAETKIIVKLLVERLRKLL